MDAQPISQAAMSATDDEGIAVGIDLGTTYSVVAHVDEFGQPVIIPNSDNDRTTPSAIYIEKDIVVVGKIAKEHMQSALGNSIQFIKTHMGRQRKQFQLGGQAWVPEELSAMILRKMVRDAQNVLNRKISHAVITVPAFFTEQQRKSTEDAGRIAGINVLGIINEPTAAALSYGYGSLGASKTIVVYDLGGGTFDVTLMRIEGDVITMLATDGDVQLGGKDWDERIIDFACEQFAARHNIDPRADPNAVSMLYQTAEQAKLRLSKLPSTKVTITYRGISDGFELTREQFEEMTEDLLAQTETTLQITVSEAGLTFDDLDEVLLVGGSTRMRAVRQMLADLIGSEPKTVLNPDECVAQGAALHAVMMQLRLRNQGLPVPPPEIRPEHIERFHSMEERLINPHTLGIIALDPNGERVVVPVIKRNDFIPCKAVKTFRSSRDGQDQIRIIVMEGESERPEACAELGMCLIKDLPAGLGRGTPIEVSFECTLDGCLNITARLPTIQQSIRAQIHRTMGMSDEEIEFSRQRVSDLVIE